MSDRSKPDRESSDLAIAVIRAAQSNPDTEAAHGDADDALCVLLETLGYEDVVEEWRRVEKWYA